MSDETLLTPEQVALRLQVTSRTVYDWLRHGRIRGLKIGRLWRVRPIDLNTFLAEPGEAVREAPKPKEALPHGSGENAPRDILQLFQIDAAELRRRNQSVIQLLDEWTDDESGYDEAVWPIVKQTIEENRGSYRRRFED